MFWGFFVALGQPVPGATAEVCIPRTKHFVLSEAFVSRLQIFDRELALAAEIDRWMNDCSFSSGGAGPRFSGQTALVIVR